jgi:predicted transcriptional regulator
VKSVLISIQPKWCELIASGKKTVEVRKTKPKTDVPFKCYIYQTKLRWVYTLLHALGFFAIARRLARGVGKVIGEFVCRNIYDIECCSDDHNYFSKNGTCLTVDEIIGYCNGKDLYGWEISDLVIYDEPKGLSEFRKYIPFFDDISTEELEAEGVSGIRLKRPPQSWCYVDHPTEKGGGE